MKTLKVVLGVSGVVAALVASMVTMSPQVGSAQGDPFVGTWEFNAAKSQYTPGPPPKTNMAIYEAAGQGIKVTAKGTGADGKPTTTQYTASYDGKDYPVTGSPDYDATSLKRIDTHHTEFTRKKAGKVVQTGTNVVSKDGKTRTITTTGVNAQGQKINNVAVFEKR